MADDAIPPVPVPILREFDFAAWQALHPNEPLPGTDVNSEFDRSDDAINLVAARLAVIQRDDGELMNGSVHLETLDPEVLQSVDQSTADAAASAAAAASSAGAASASEAAAEESASDAAASEASAAASAAQASVAKNDAEAAAATAQDAAASIDGLIPALPGAPGAVIRVDATGNDYELHQPLPPMLVADVGKALVVNPTHDGVAYVKAITLVAGGGTAFEAGGFPIANVTNPTNAQDAATKNYVDTAISGSGSVPPPLAGDANKALVASGAGVFGWAAIVAAMISDATAYMRGLLTTINDATGFRTAISAASAAQAVPVPANPADDGKALRANAGNFAWGTVLEVPAPANPGDDNKILRANGGAYAWQTPQQLVPVPANPADDGKVLTASAGAYAWTALINATNAVKGIIKLETAAEVTAGVDTASALSIGEFAASKFNPLGRQTYLLQAGALVPHPTAGPTAAVVAEANGQIYRVLNFADAATQSAGIAIALNKKIDITQAFNVRIRFKASVLGNVRWTVGYSTSGDGEAINVAQSTVALTAANGVINTNEITAQIVCAWPAGTTKEDTLYLTLFRLGADGADTLAGVASLVDLEVAFITDKGNDA